MVKSNIDLNVVNTVLLFVILVLVLLPYLNSKDNFQNNNMYHPKCRRKGMYKQHSGALTKSGGNLGYGRRNVSRQNAGVKLAI